MSPLHPRYEDCGIAAKRTRAFAEAVGARVELKIEKATCRENPQWDYLRSVGGDHNTSPSDRDWHIPKLAGWSPCGSHVISGWQSLVLQSISRRTRMPNSPHELTSHRCINLRGGSSGPYRWEFEKGGETLVVDVNGPLVLDDADLMIRAATDGSVLSQPPPAAGRVVGAHRDAARVTYSVETSRTILRPRSPAPTTGHRMKWNCGMSLRDFPGPILRFSLRIRRVEPPVAARICLSKEIAKLLMNLLVLAVAGRQGVSRFLFARLPLVAFGRQLFHTGVRAAVGRAASG